MIRTQDVYLRGKHDKHRNISAAQLCAELYRDKVHMQTQNDPGKGVAASCYLVRLEKMDRKSSVGGEKSCRANGLVAGLRNPVLQYLGIVEIVSEQNQCPRANFPPPK